MVVIGGDMVWVDFVDFFVIQYLSDIFHDR